MAEKRGVSHSELIWRRVDPSSLPAVLGDDDIKRHQLGKVNVEGCSFVGSGSVELALAIRSTGLLAGLQQCYISGITFKGNSFVLPWALNRSLTNANTAAQL